MLVADMHCDTISEIFHELKKGNECCLYRNNLHIDVEKMIKGDYLFQCFAMHVDLKLSKAPLADCMELIDLFYKQLELNNNLGLALSFDDIIKNRQEGKISALLTIEEGGVTNCSLSQLRNFYRLGVRLLTLTWKYENGIGYPSCRYSETPDCGTKDTENGLTEFGLEFINEMERLGMMIDVSHLSDAGFYQVLKNTKKPFVASHSNARARCGHVRNLTDDMIRSIAERGGVIGINFCPYFLEDAANEGEAEGTIAAIIAHIKHIAAVGGYECIALGSDFDGIPTNNEMRDASYMPRLADALAKSGITQSEIELIFHKNVLRVFKELI